MTTTFEGKCNNHQRVTIVLKNAFPVGRMGATVPFVVKLIAQRSLITDLTEDQLLMAILAGLLSCGIPVVVTVTMQETTVKNRDDGALMLDHVMFITLESPDSYTSVNGINGLCNEGPIVFVPADGVPIKMLRDIADYSAKNEHSARYLMAMVSTTLRTNGYSHTTVTCTLRQALVADHDGGVQLCPREQHIDVKMTDDCNCVAIAGSHGRCGRCDEAWFQA